MNDRLISIDNESEVVKSKELSQILKERAMLEAEEAEIAKNEKALVDKEEIPEKSEGITSTELGSEALQSIEKAIDQKKHQIEILRAEIANDEVQLAQKKSELEARRAKNVRNLTGTVIILVMLGLLLIGAFYLVGRNKRRKSV